MAQGNIYSLMNESLVGNYNDFSKKNIKFSNDKHSLIAKNLIKKNL